MRYLAIFSKVLDANPMMQNVKIKTYVFEAETDEKALAHVQDYYLSAIMELDKLFLIGHEVDLAKPIVHHDDTPA